MKEESDTFEFSDLYNFTRPELEEMKTIVDRIESSKKELTEKFGITIDDLRNNFTKTIFKVEPTIGPVESDVDLFHAIVFKMFGPFADQHN